MAINRKKFFELYRKSFGVLAQETVDVLDTILDVFDKNLDEPQAQAKMAYMLATVRHEVGPKMTPIVENMNYSAKRITEVWPSRFKTIAAAEPYAHNPAKLGNNVYANRLGNGPPESGDGYRYRGRGIGAQFTGRVNYEKFSKMFNVDLINNPDLAMNVKLGAEILYVGSIRGLFTGVGLSKYINAGDIDFVNARRVINADVARNGRRIASDALKYQNILSQSWD